MKEQIVMGLLDLALDEELEDEVVPEGPYDLQIESFTEKSSKAGNTMYEAIIRVEDADYPNAAGIFEYFLIPDDDTPDRTARLFKRRWKRLCQVVGIDASVAFDPEEAFEGATFNCLVTQEEIEEGALKGEMTNRLKLPKSK